MNAHRLLVLSLWAISSIAISRVESQEPGKQAIYFDLLVPADALVLLNGTKTTPVGESRRFVTPPLELGREYVYSVAVTSGGRTATRDISVGFDRKNEFDFRPEFTLAAPAASSSAGAAASIRSIAEEAFIYAYPIVMGYGILHEFSIDKNSSQFKGPFNQIANSARVFTPKDTAVVTPNSDTPYSMLSVDLRAEPIVLTVPAIERSRYYSVQMVDLYTCNFGYIGSRSTGNDGGVYMIAGPRWNGAAPENIAKVFRCETDFALVIYRTQLFNPADIDNVKKVQAGYKVQTLSAYLKQPAPPAASTIEWPTIDRQSAETNPFTYLSFILQFCPAIGAAEVETSLRARFAKLGIEAGKPFSLEKLTADEKTDLEEGAKAGYARIKQRVATIGKEENGWRVGGAQGNRDFYKGDWTLRAAAAMAGIYGNDEVEALYPLLATDNEGNKADCSNNRYTLTFAKGQLPPANAFWSVTMYDGKSQLLIENPINRYLINSPMLPDMKKNADGSLTIYIQSDAPVKELQANWLPAPNGPIYLVMRLYWPKESALNGVWKPPFVTRTLH